MLTLLSCSPKVTTEETPIGKSATLDAVAKNNFKADYKILYNSDKSFAAVYSDSKTDGDEYSNMKILLFDNKNNKIVWGRKAYKGSLIWESKSKLKVDYYDNNNKKNTVIYDTKKKEVTYLQ